MKEYIVKKVSSPLALEDERWGRAEVAELNDGWDAFPKQYTTTARLLYSDEGLFLRMETDEWPIIVKETKENHEVCFDSCMEFFFTPNTTDDLYVNFEANAHGVPLCSVRNDRERGRIIKSSREGVVVKAICEFERGWALYMFIPFEFLKKHFSSIGKEMRANFYKCGEQTLVDHYAVWNKIETPEPDYHRPEFFGRLILSDEII